VTRKPVRSASIKTLRCAVYTRKSTEHGLELEFNSLDAQREACEAYIKSQASEGWTCLSKRYDDAAFSGGTLERPALRRLLKDIEAGLVDVVVVYKIDRLTRSLSDFAKLVEIFDAQSISFVAVTQQFNTTTSMGRLTLNILLSFAQFERELSSERVRDKVAASRKKGKWTGGTVPLGYDSRDKKLAVNPAEAKTVRMIFERYLALKSAPKLIEELDRKGVVTKKRALQGKTAGNVPFTYGSLVYLLKNRTYVGEVGHDGKWFEGEHEPILDRELFARAQEVLKSNAVRRRKQRAETGALLSGLLYDDRGHRMSPSYSVKNGVRYPFYVSAAILKGRKREAGSIARVGAPQIETLVIASLRKHLQQQDDAVTSRTLLEQCVDRITIFPAKITINLKADSSSAERAAGSFDMPWSPAKKTGLVEISEPNDSSPPSPKSELVQALVRAHVWLAQLKSGTFKSIEDLAQAVKIHPKNIRLGLKLAFLSPQLVREILRGEQAPAITVTSLGNISELSWMGQEAALKSRNSHRIMRPGAAGDQGHVT
jgi:DNA invertase Pin-like site-specific DNA recombinase